MTPDALPLAQLAPARLAALLTLQAGSRAGGTAVVGMPAALVLAALSGVAYAAAFPPLSWPIAAWVAMVPLLVLCAALSPLRAAVVGMCYSTTAAVGVAGFLPGMLSHYFGLAAVPSWLAAAAIAAGLNGAWVSGYAAWVAWLARRRAANPILLAGGWLVCEFARAHGVLGTPWALTAYAQVRWMPVIQIADLAGPYGIGMLVAAVNAGLAALLVPALRGRRPLLSALTIAAALAGTLMYGQWRLGQTFDGGPDVRVAVVQGGAPPAERSERAARLERYVTLTTNGAQARTDLIVWPEYAIEAYLEEASPTRETVLRVADQAHADLILGGPHYVPSASGTHYHNSVYLVHDGRVAARYDKHRLVPFAEDDRLARLRGDPRSYTQGLGSFVLPSAALRVGAVLCVESMFPDLVRQAVRDGAEVLVNLSNDAWFGDPDAARQQLDIASLRAVENRRYLVRAASTGFSAVVDPHGRALARSELDADQVLNSTVRASRAHTPYERGGDVFAWAVMAWVAGATLRSLLGETVTSEQRRSS